MEAGGGSGLIHAKAAFNFACCPGHVAPSDTPEIFYLFPSLAESAFHPKESEKQELAYDCRTHGLKVKSESKCQGFNGCVTLQVAPLIAQGGRQK